MATQSNRLPLLVLGILGCFAIVVLVAIVAMGALPFHSGIIVAGRLYEALPGRQRYLRSAKPIR